MSFRFRVQGLDSCLDPEYKSPLVCIPTYNALTNQRTKTRAAEGMAVDNPQRAWSLVGGSRIAIRRERKWDERNPKP